LTALVLTTKQQGNKTPHTS